MPKLYSAEIWICATVYMVAETEAEALQAVRDLDGCALELPTGYAGDGIEISGESFNADMPELSLSPAVTVYASNVSDHLIAKPRGEAERERTEAERERLSVAISGAITNARQQMDSAAVTLLREAVNAWPQVGTDDEINGGDMVDWFGGFHQQATALLDGTAADSVPTITIPAYLLEEGDLARLLAAAKDCLKTAGPNDKATPAFIVAAQRELVEGRGCDPEGRWLKSGEYADKVKRYNAALGGVTPNGDDYGAIIAMLDGAPYHAPRGVSETPPRRYRYTAESCPSKHWNDGTDTCADCGASLN